MNPEDAIKELRAEVMALQTVLIGLIRTVRSGVPQGPDIIDRAFRYAEYVTDLTSARLGAHSATEYVTRTAQIIEELRSSAMDDPGNPKHGV